MESIKRKWGKPGLDVQVFMPNEYCAPCGDGTTQVTYYFMCDGGYASMQYDVWIDTNKNGKLDGHYVHHSGHGGWDEWVWDDEYLTEGHYFHPCDEKHTVTVPEGTNVDDIFPYGLMTPKGWTSPVTPVRIWRGKNSDNVHCTTQLNSSSFTPHNPS